MPEKNEHTAYVTFSISAPDLDPDEISALLVDVTPTHTHHQGDMPQASPRSSAAPSPYKHGMWSLRSGLPPDEPLEAHLEQLLSTLEVHQPEIKSLSAKNRVYFGCDLFGPIGLDLSADTLTRMGSLGATFGVTVYPDYGGSELGSES